MTTTMVTTVMMHNAKVQPMSSLGVRSTKQRTAVAAALAELDDFRSTQEIHEYLKDRGDSVGLTTVYRTLQALSAAGDVDVILREDGESVYRVCSTSHHHHLVCRQCGHTVEVEGPAVERWADSVSAANGFTSVSHTLEIFGLCSTCSD
jgi:Fur family ferric uptake transcriptional regulator